MGRKIKKQGLLHNFKIYPMLGKGGRLFFDVLIYKDNRSMIKAFSKAHPCSWKSMGNDNAFLAICQSFTIETISQNTWKQEMILGEIFFSLDDLDFETIVHECTHAAFSWVRRRFGHVVMTDDKIHIEEKDLEEQFAYVNGILSYQVFLYLSENQWGCNLEQAGCPA